MMLDRYFEAGEQKVPRPFGLRAYVVSWLRILAASIRYMGIRFRLFIWESDTDTVRFILNVVSTLTAVLLFLPGETLKQFPYSGLGVFGWLTEPIWATLFLVQGLTGFYSLFWDKRGSLAMFLDPMLGCVLWSLSCLGMLFSTYPPSPATVWTGVGALVSWWLIVRFPLQQKAEEGESDAGK